METLSTNPEDVCTTQKAAQVLGISVTSVQQLVESGVIDAWKTKGGHRRIPLAALYAYKSKAGISTGLSTSDKNATIMIIEDDPIQREIYATQFANWNLPADLMLFENGYQALIAIARTRPEVLLADIVMQGIDGYEVIQTILGYPDLVEINIAILSGLMPEELEKRGGIPEGVVFFSKPINYDELRGYLRACCARKARQRRNR